MGKPAALLQGTLDLLILKILDLEPRSGWSISQRLRQMSGDTLKASHGALYPALHKLENEGWIESEWQQGPSGRPIKIYSLTKAGRKQLRTEAENWTKLSSAVNSILETT